METLALHLILTVVLGLVWLGSDEPEPRTLHFGFLKSIAKGIGGAVKGIGKGLGKVAGVVAPVAGMIPGVGTLTGAAIGGLGGLLSGGGLKGAAQGALSGLGPWGSLASAAIGGLGGGPGGQGPLQGANLGNLGNIGALAGMGYMGHQAYNQAQADSQRARELSEQSMGWANEERLRAINEWEKGEAMRNMFRQNAMNFFDPTNPFSNPMGMQMPPIQPPAPVPPPVKPVPMPPEKTGGWSLPTTPITPVTSASPTRTAPPMVTPNRAQPDDGAQIPTVALDPNEIAIGGSNRFGVIPDLANTAFGRRAYT